MARHLGLPAKKETDNLTEGLSSRTKEINYLHKEGTSLLTTGSLTKLFILLLMRQKDYVSPWNNLKKKKKKP